MVLLRATRERLPVDDWIEIAMVVVVAGCALTALIEWNAVRRNRRRDVAEPTTRDIILGIPTQLPVEEVAQRVSGALGIPVTLRENVSYGDCFGTVDKDDDLDTLQVFE